MKTKRRVVSRSARSRPLKLSRARVSSIKHRVQKKRPLHKRLVLHPVSLLFLLCIGVLLCAATINTLADTLNVSAQIDAPLLTQPAVITSPTDNSQVSPQAITVSGTCPLNSYVNLTDNNTFVGSDICSASQTFQIALDMSDGQNVLQAQDYNITDQPGPSSSPVTVYYTPPPAPPSSSTPSSSSASSSGGTVAVVAANQLQVIDNDTGSSFTPSNNIPVVSDDPTFVGIAPPYSLVVVEIHSNPFYCRTYADSQGYWSCTFDQVIPQGLHTVYVTALTAANKTLSLTPFSMIILPVKPQPAKTGNKFGITASYSYKVYQVGQPVNLAVTVNGGVAPFAVTVNWGDGDTSTYLQKTDGNFAVNHTYSWINAALGTETIKMEAIDTNGNVSSLQLQAVLRNPVFKIGTTKKTGISAFLNDVKPWLKLLWPGYLIIILMAAAFWLGEKQEVMALMKARQKVKHQTVHK